MASNDKIVQVIQQLVAESDLNTVTVKLIRKKLADVFQVDLDDKKDFVKVEIVKAVEARQSAEADSESSESESEESEEKPKKAAAKRKAPAAAKAPKGKKTKKEEEKDAKGKKKRKVKGEKVKRKGGGGGLQKPMLLSETLSAVLGGEKILPRTMVVKKLWEYIKKNELQDPSDRRTIIADESFRRVFAEPRFTVFTMNKLLSPHLKNPESEGIVVPKPEPAAAAAAPEASGDANVKAEE